MENLWRAALYGNLRRFVRPRRSERRVNEHEEPVGEETVVENVSIEGMCGVH
jgi:mycofactocin precursor